VKTGFKVNTAGMPCSLRECGRSLGELQNRRNADSNSRNSREASPFFELAYAI